MADSNITKRALAMALKELMEEKNFEKININDICERCDMNRKSFYYHFKDKYDLVNWIFDTEFVAVVRTTTHNDIWLAISKLADFLYENRNFYRDALSIKGQNSFSDHFKELMLPVISLQVQAFLKSDTSQKFQIQFFTDAIVMTFQRWLTDYPSMTAEEFIDELKQTLCYLASRYDEYFGK